MTSFSFKPATKKQLKLRLGLVGPSGSGKTYSALAIGTQLGERVALIDSEHGSASLYSDAFRFDVLELDSFAPETYVEAIRTAENAGYDVIIIDSLSHAWMGKDGALEQVDNAKRRSSGGNGFTAWRDVTPKHNAMIDAIVSCRAHLIATMRAKTEYVLDTVDDGRGKKTTRPRKVGMAPIQRDGMEYEFTVVGDLDADNYFSVTKTRCAVLGGKVIEKPGAQLAKILKDWLASGAAAASSATTASNDDQPPAAIASAREAGQRVDRAPPAPAGGSRTLVQRIRFADSPEQLKQLRDEIAKLPRGSDERREAIEAGKRRQLELEEFAQREAKAAQ